MLSLTDSIIVCALVVLLIISRAESLLQSVYDTASVINNNCNK